MNKLVAVGVGVVLLVLLLLFSTTYTVKFNEVAIKSRFGQADESSIVREDGLHMRMPVVIDKVTKLDTRLQLLESPLETIETQDGLQLVVRAYLLWRVDMEKTGPLDFFKRYSSIEAAAQPLSDQFRTAFTNVLASFQFEDLIGKDSKLAQAESDIEKTLAAQFAGSGVTPAKVGFSQIVLPAKTSSAVLKRMQATRNVSARGERGAGKAKADSIRSHARTLAEKIKAIAENHAESIRAKTREREAEYLKQMSEDEELAIFLVSLDTLRQSLSDLTTLIIPTNQRPFNLMAPGTAAFEESIPRPARLQEGQVQKEELDADEPALAERGD